MKTKSLFPAWLFVLLLIPNALQSQSFVNGSFETTTASVACNYNLTNAGFNGMMSNTNAFGGGQECDILIAGCYQPSIPDGIRAVGLAHVPVDEIAMALTAPLVMGNTYTFTFWSYSETTFRVQGNLEIGASTVNNNFGTSIYIATTTPMTWVQHSVTFVAPNNTTFITVRNVVDGIIHWNHVDHFAFTSCPPPTIDLGNDTTLCPGATLMLDATTTSSTYLWQNNSTNSTFNVTQAGTYFVEVTDGCGTGYDTINVNYDALPTVDLGPDTTLCPQATLNLDASAPNVSWLWQDNSTNSSFTVSAPGTYWVDVSNNCGIATDTVQVNYSVPGSVYLGNDTTLCPGASLLLDAGNPGNTFLWQDNSTNQTFNVTQAGTFWVEITDACETYADTIAVFYTNALTLDLGNDTILCNGATLTLDASAPNVTWLWQDNSTNGSYIVTQAGTYWVEMTDGCSSASDTVVVGFTAPLTLNLGNDTSLCNGAVLPLDATNPNATYLWQDASVNATFNVSQSGTYWVEVSNLCELITDTINVSYNVPLTLDLGNDTLLCPGSSLLLTATNANATYTWQDNSTGATFNVTQAGTFFVEVDNGCETLSDTLMVSYGVLPVVNLGNDTTLCQGALLLLDASNPNATYLWQDNSTGATFNVTQSGTYTVDVTNNCGTVSASINVNYLAPPAVNLGNDSSLCSGATIVLDATTPNATYLWQDNSTNPTFTVSQQGTYFVTVSNACGAATDSIFLEFNTAFSFDLGNDTTLCTGESLLLWVSVPNASVEWQDQSVGGNYLVQQEGVYYAVVHVGSCVNSDTIVVLMVDAPKVDIGPDLMLCEGDYAVLSTEYQDGFYHWNTGSSEPVEIADTFGVYILSLTNGCGTTSDTVYIMDMECGCDVYIPNTFTPDGDEMNQTFQVAYECDFYFFELHIYNRWGERIFSTQDPDAIWDGTYHGRRVPSGTYVYTVVYENESSDVKTFQGHVNVLY